MEVREARQVTGRTQMKLEDIEARYKAANLRELAPGFGKVFGGTDCLVVGYRDSMNGLPGRILCVVSDRDSMNKEDEAAADLIASLPDLLAIAQGQREEMERLRHFGGKLSNLAFNLKQFDSIPDGHRQMLRIAQEGWDNATKPIGTKK